MLQSLLAFLSLYLLLAALGCQYHCSCSLLLCLLPVDCYVLFLLAAIAVHLMWLRCLAATTSSAHWNMILPMPLLFICHRNHAGWLLLSFILCHCSWSGLLDAAAALAVAIFATHFAAKFPMASAIAACFFSKIATSAGWLHLLCSLLSRVTTGSIVCHRLLSLAIIYHCLPSFAIMCHQYVTPTAAGTSWLPRLLPIVDLPPCDCCIKRQFCHHGRWLIVASCRQRILDLLLQLLRYCRCNLHCVLRNAVTLIRTRCLHCLQVATFTGWLFQHEYNMTCYHRLCCRCNWLLKVLKIIIPSTSYTPESSTY